MNEARSILLKKYPFSETSLIAVWLTDCHGKIKTSIRGGRKFSGPLAGRLELFSESSISFKDPKKGDLYTLVEVTPSMSAPIPATYDTILAASYFSDLIDLFTVAADPVPEIYALVERAWGFLRGKTPTTRAVLHFEAEMAKHLGVYDPSIPAHESLSSMAPRMPDSRKRLLNRLLQ